MKSQIKKVSLTSTMDIEYRRRGQQRSQRSRNYGQPSKRNEYEKLTYLVEGLIRKILEKSFKVSKCRILKYHQGGDYRYRELDVVLLDDQDNPTTFIEIKTSVVSNICPALRQLRKNLQIGRIKWENLNGIVIWVDSSCLNQNENKKTSPLTKTVSMKEVISVLHLKDLKETSDFRVSLEDVLDMSKDFLTSCPKELCKKAAEALIESQEVSRKDWEGTTYIDSGFDKGTNPFKKIAFKKS